MVSALISSKSAPALLLDKAGESYSLFISKDILLELEGVISRDKFEFTAKDINTIINTIVAFSEVINPEIKLEIIKSDPEDNKILECAVACGASYIVSGDGHLLQLKKYKDIKIINPRKALELLE